ncbi:hypothetical protein [Oceanobacillus sp. AG]|uniref:hypothetical protein n=1 Tax=Oceanobacillus sp. AG TaxID=2681969 RepID=UPI0012EC39B7|nr:hypothetical protein [Oceanobacillus sp. AG]
MERWIGKINGGCFPLTKMERWIGKINGGYFPLGEDGALDWENKRRLFYLERR